MFTNYCRLGNILVIVLQDKQIIIIRYFKVDKPFIMDNCFAMDLSFIIGYLLAFDKQGAEDFTEVNFLIPIIVDYSKNSDIASS